MAMSEGLCSGGADAVGREGGPVLGKRVRKLEPRELALFDEDLAEQRAALALHLEGCFAIVRCDESEVDEDLPDRTTDAESERADGWDDRRQARPRSPRSCLSPFSCESSREISGWGTANSATTIWSSGSPVLSANLSARSSCSGTSRFSSTRSGPRNSAWVSTLFNIGRSSADVRTQLLGLRRDFHGTATMKAMNALSLGTPHGQARALIREAEAPRGVVVLGHGRAAGSRRGIRRGEVTAAPDVSGCSGS